MNRLAAWTAGLSLFSLASIATAQEDPFTREKIQASGHLGYGLDVSDNAMNPYGFLLGARGGYTLEQDIYVGGLFDYFFGGSAEGD